MSFVYLYRTTNKTLINYFRMAICFYDHPRSLSKSKNNKAIVKMFRNLQISEFLSNTNQGEKYFGWRNRYTFVLPNTQTFHVEKKSLILNDLVDFYEQYILERAYVINWWLNQNIATKFYALKAPKNGNSLFNAVSLAIWGVTDGICVLRRAVKNAMAQSCKKNDFKSRLLLSKTNQGGIDAQWDNLFRKVELNQTAESNIMRQFNNNEMITEKFYEAEAFHVSILSYVLRRPIIVVGESYSLWVNHDEDLSPCNVRGIYLPVERDPKDCSCNPIIIAFAHHHFIPLAPMNMGNNYKDMKNKIAFFPLVAKRKDMLPLMFGGSEAQGDENKKIAFLKKYLDIHYKTFNSNQSNYAEDEEEIKPSSQKNDDSIKKNQTSSEENENEEGNENTNAANEILCCRMVCRRPTFILNLITNYLTEVEERLPQINRNNLPYVTFIKNQNLNANPDDISEGEEEKGDEGGDKKS